MTFRFLINLLLAGVILCAPVLLIAQEVPNEEVPQGVTIHVVQRGENLFRIALRYSTSVDELVAMNGLSDPTQINIGQRLLVPTSETVEPTPLTHIVQPGETLFTIAQLYEVDVDALVALNDVTNTSQIYSGQLLTIIAVDENLEVIGEATEAVIIPILEPINELPTISSNAHIVQSGETLFRIALQYELSVQELASANGISDPTVIYVGQQLVIPGVSESPTAELDLPEPIIGLDIRPLIFVEGETGFIQVSTSISSAITGTFLGRDLTVITLDNKTQHIMIIGVPMFTETGIYPVELSLNNDDGSQTEFGFNIRVAVGGYGTQNLNVTESELTSPAVQDNELNLLINITSTITLDRFWDGPFSIPAAAAMNAGYGTRRSYNGGPVNTFHSGADFASAPSTPIFAAASGRVVLADALNIRGNALVIDHGWGVYSVYAHQTTLNVTLGEMVTTGQVIGTAGSTGRITGPHLHWEIWINGTPVNPLTWTQQTFP